MSPVSMLKNWCDYTVETRYETLISKEKGTVSQDLYTPFLFVELSHMGL